MAGPRRLTELADSVLERIRIPTGEMAVAVSGGADSAVLAWAIAERGRVAAALHVHHGLPASDHLAAAASGVAAGLGVPFELLRVDAGSSEASARQARYRALAEAADPSWWVATGHTLDDQAETVLMNLLRGAGPTGLAGIPARRHHLVRPMLAVRRSETRELATLLGLPWVDDPTNDDLAILRNRVRRVVLPDLAATVNPAVVAHLASFAAIAEEESEELDRLTPPVVEVASGSARVPAAVLATSPPAVAARLVRRMWQALGFEHPPSRATVEAVKTVAESGAPGTVEAGVAVRLVGAHIQLGGAEAGDPPAPVTLRVPGSARWGRFTFQTLVEETGPITPLSPWAMVAPLPPRATLVVRSAGPDDRIDCGHGSKPVSEALREAGVPAGERRSRPLVELDGRVVWIPGARRVGWPRPPGARYLSAVAVEESPWGPFES